MILIRANETHLDPNTNTPIMYSEECLQKMAERNPNIEYNKELKALVYVGPVLKYKKYK